MPVTRSGSHLKQGLACSASCTREGADPDGGVAIIQRLVVQHRVLPASRIEDVEGRRHPHNHLRFAQSALVIHVC